MALGPLKLPRLKANLALVNGKGNPLDYFLRFWNIEVAPRIEQNEAAQNQSIQDIQDILDALTATQQAAQQAQAAANEAQATADMGSGSVSGTASNPAVDVPTGGVWVNGPQVNLTSVVAVNLTITGSGPQQDADVSVDTSLRANLFGDFRIVEVVSGVDTVLFTGNYTVNNIDPGRSTPVVTNTSISDVAAFSSARTSTGAVSYRIDVRNNSPYDIFSLLLYIFVRRAA